MIVVNAFDPWWASWWQGALGVASIVTAVGFFAFKQFVKSLVTRTADQYVETKLLPDILRNVGERTKVEEQARALVAHDAALNRARWELKRELYSDVLPELWAVRDLTSRACNLYDARHEATVEVQDLVKQARTHESRVRDARGKLGIILTRDAESALDAFLSSCMEVDGSATSWFDELDGRAAAAKTAFDRLTSAARTDLFPGGAHALEPHPCTSPLGGGP